MTPLYQRYLALLEELRVHRSAPGWTVASDPPLLDASDAVFEELSDEEQEAARGESWRASPAKVAQAEALRAQVQAKLQRVRETPRGVAPDPPPVYDGVYFEGMDWLDKNG